MIQMGGIERIFEQMFTHKENKHCHLLENLGQSIYFLFR